MPLKWSNEGGADRRRPSICSHVAMGGHALRGGGLDAAGRHEGFDEGGGASMKGGGKVLRVKTRAGGAGLTLL